MSTTLSKIIEAYPDDDFLKADGFDDAIVGVEPSTGKLVYSINTCISILMERDGMSHTDAIEYFYFNVSGSYMGDKTPIWINDNF